MSPRLGIRAALLLFCLLAKLSSAQGLDPDGPRPQVQINMYSGRPDPVFELSDEDGVKIRNLVDKLPTDADPTYQDAAPNILGYRGYTIFALPDGKTKEYSVVRVYRTGVEVRTFSREEGSSKAVAKLDSSRSVETMLTQFAVEKGLLGPVIKERIDSGVDKRQKNKR